MKIQEVLQKYHKIEIELLLAHVLKKPKEFLYVSPNYKLTPSQANKLLQLIRRREKGEPIAYITGTKGFYGLDFKVTKDVLIPRPETEMMVDRILGVIPEFRMHPRNIRDPESQLKPLRNNYVSGSRVSAALARDGTSTIKILDLGTGSGCIMVSLAYTLHPTTSNFRFYASDISKKALAVAKENAKHHKVKVNFIQSDLLKNIKEDFDVLIANLPYLDSQWKTDSIKHEPKYALFTGEHGLKLIRILLEQIAAKKNKPKLVYLEFDPRQKQELSLLIKKTLPSSQSKFFKDLSGLWRFVEIKIK